MIYLSFRNDIDSQAAQELHLACQEALGDKTKCSLLSPQYIPASENNPESWVGGVEFEWNSRATPTVKDSCCYTIGLSHQCPRKLTSPVAAAKMELHQQGILDNNQRNCYAITKVGYGGSQ
jgi:hypothetical protein